MSTETVNLSVPADLMSGEWPDGKAFSPDRLHMSTRVDQLFEALADAQGEFEIVAKTENNPFFKSLYAGLPSVVQAATPILASHGIALTQPIGHDSEGDLLWTVLGHKSGQFIACAMRLRPVKNDPQAQGSATTYGRRYSYMSSLGLVADEDDDGNHATRGASSPPARKPQEARRRQPAPKPTEPSAKPAEPASDPDNPPASDALLMEINGPGNSLYKQARISASRMREIITEACGGEDGGPQKKLSDLSTDQANGVKLKLRRIIAANDSTRGEDDD